MAQVPQQQRAAAPCNIISLEPALPENVQSVKKAFKRRGCETLADRPALEFLHLSRDQLQAHDAHSHSLPLVSQRQTTASRQWRRDRQQLLRRHGIALDARLRCKEEQRERRESAAEHQQKQRRCREQLEAERLAGSLRRWRECKNFDAQLREGYGYISICNKVERKCREISQRADQILQEPKPTPPREVEPKRVQAARCNERRRQVAGGLGQ